MKDSEFKMFLKIFKNDFELRHVTYMTDSCKSVTSMLNYCSNIVDSYIYKCYVLIRLNMFSE